MPEFTAAIKQDGDWWIGWIEEIPGVNCQEKSKVDLIAALRETLQESIEMNRDDARSAAGQGYEQIKIAV